MIVNSLEIYLKHLTAEVCKHGREALQWADDPGSLLVGFRSPTGFWQLELSVLKTEFSKNQPWRENTSVVEAYKKLGGAAPLKALTRVPPPKELAQLYGNCVREAIAEGERLRSLPS